MDKKTIKIGTRGSAMALAQTDLVMSRLAALHPGIKFERVVVAVTGDAIQDRTLASSGGKALFCKELEYSLLAGQIDAAVHSCKDVATFPPAGLVFGAILPRDDYRDAFISRDGLTLDRMPRGARIGTASVRRRAQLLAYRPDLNVLPMRGNANTRLAKLGAGIVDAIVLGAAGMERIGLSSRIAELLPIERALPAPTQATIVVQIQQVDEFVHDLIRPLDDQDARDATDAERGFLEALTADCNNPLAALATVEAGRLFLRTQALSENGGVVLSDQREGDRRRARDIGLSAGNRIKELGGPAFFDVPQGSVPAL